MPDIAMCMNSEGCPSRLRCWRARAKPSQPQSYMKFYTGEGDRCDHYWPVSIVEEVNNQ